MHTVGGELLADDSIGSSRKKNIGWLKSRLAICMLRLLIAECSWTRDLEAIRISRADSYTRPVHAAVVRGDYRVRRRRATRAWTVDADRGLHHVRRDGNRLFYEPRAARFFPNRQ